MSKRNRRGQRVSGKKNTKKGKIRNLVDKVRESPINYFSDLFIVAMVTFWIADNILESVIASVVTLSSVVLSLKTGMQMYDTSMWASIGSNVAIPLSTGGALWMIKNGVQHAIVNRKGRVCPSDFPKVDALGENDGNEELLFPTDETEVD